MTCTYLIIIKLGYIGPYSAISVPSFDDKIMEAKYEETILLHRTGKYCINVSTGASHTTNLKIVVSIKYARDYPIRRTHIWCACTHTHTQTGNRRVLEKDNLWQ